MINILFFVMLFLPSKIYRGACNSKEPASLEKFSSKTDTSTEENIIDNLWEIRNVRQRLKIDAIKFIVENHIIHYQANQYIDVLNDIENLIIDYNNIFYSK